jgi:hypothetical protein
MYDSARSANVDGVVVHDVTGLDMEMRNQIKGTTDAIEPQPTRRSSQKSPTIPIRMRSVATASTCYLCPMMVGIY